MRRLPVEAALILALVVATGCGKDETPAPAATPPAANAPAATTPAPAPVAPTASRTAEGPARDAALAMGPGTCEEDVPAIRVLPAKGELGADPRFDRILVHRDAYKACLVAMVRDATPIADPGEGAKRTPYAQGDLAYDVLVRVGFIQHGECIPGDVMRRVDGAGAQAINEWLATTNHRRQLLRCLGKQLGT